MKKKRIYVYGTRGFPHMQGGVEKHCEYLYPELAGRYKIYVFRRKPFLADDEPELPGDIEFIDLPSTRRAGCEAFFHSFLCTLYCLLVRPDIIHVHNIGPGIFIPLLKMAGLKVVLTYHSVNYEHDKWGFWAKKVLKISEYFATKGADRIIFVNKNRIPLFSDKIQAKSVFIPNGVQLREQTEETDYVASLGLLPGRYILSVGRITQEKGLDCLVDAFLQSNLSSCQLVLAGGIDHPTRYAEHFYRKIQEHSNILVPGYVDGENLRQLYSHARLFVLSSYSEGFPLVLLEAMNYQLPILASDIPGNRLLRLNDEDYFKTGDAEDLSAHLRKELERPPHPRMYDISPYTWEKIAGQVAEVYKSQQEAS
ncbi:MAG: glycosyltransferase family 4 protein [Tannerellaceae bacterium]|jgi:glycosyltransferase involved in cell wall biosynthesis|nr:glycosyltransferase family 4 protein [Tannerellaceae bacterium]